jgi:fructokinase
MTVVTGIDVGGTKIEAAALNVNTKKELFRKKISTPKNYEDFIGSIKSLIDEADDCAKEKCPVGMGFPGLVTSDGKVRDYANLPFLKKDVIFELEELLSRKIKVANDADCLALSETVDGAAQGAKIAFCAILGTGDGAGITVGGRLLQGKNGFAGEWGHISQPYPKAWELEQPCPCGCRGHIESLNCAPSLVRIYNEKTTDKISDSVEIYERCKQGDEIARQVLNDFYDRLARAFVAVSNIIDPDVFVLGGGLSLVDEIYEKVPPLYTEYMKEINGTSPVLNLKRAKHGSSSGLRGAAWLCL